MLLSEGYNNGSNELEDKTTTWPFCTQHTTELVGKEAVYWLVIDLDYQGESELLMHDRSKEDCVHNPGDALEHILFFP